MDLDWAIRMAAVACVKGNLDRDSLYQELNKKDFSADGATAKVKFNQKSHDRDSLTDPDKIGVLVKVQNNKFVVDEKLNK